MASPNSTFTELVSTTFRKHRKEIKDNLSNRNALVKYIYKRGNYAAKTVASDRDSARLRVERHVPALFGLGHAEHRAVRRDLGCRVPVAPDRDQRGRLRS
jgi:hypothetical protein